MNKLKTILKVFILFICLFIGQELYANKPIQKDTLKWERKVIENDFYRIVVSGYNPQIDTVEIYLRDKVTTKYLIKVDNDKKIKKTYNKIKKSKN